MENEESITFIVASDAGPLPGANMTSLARAGSETGAPMLHEPQRCWPRWPDVPDTDAFVKQFLSAL